MWSEFAFLLFCVADPQSASKKITWAPKFIVWCPTKRPPTPSFYSFVQKSAHTLFPTDPQTRLPKIGVQNQPFPASIAAARMSHWFVSAFIIYTIVRSSFSMLDSPNRQIIALVALV